jgi:hypothetical protein
MLMIYLYYTANYYLHYTNYFLYYTKCQHYFTSPNPNFTALRPLHYTRYHLDENALDYSKSNFTQVPHIKYYSIVRMCALGCTVTTALAKKSKP